MPYFVPYIDSTGLHLPTYEDRLTNLLSAYRSIFGQDTILDESTPDYQLLSVFARALDDLSALLLDTFNARNPDYAVGRALDLLCPLFGISRRPSETDAALRLRLKGAFAARACATRESLEAALRALEYVQDVSVVTNETDQTDENGIPPHSLACVVYSGRNADIAQTIFDKKAPGISTFGTTTANATDAAGRPRAVRFSRPTTLLITIAVKIRPLAGYDPAVQETLRAAIVSYVQSLGIGTPLVVSQLYGVCYSAVPASQRTTFMIGDILTSSSQGSHSDIYPCAWNARLTTVANSVTFTEIT